MTDQISKDAGIVLDAMIEAWRKHAHPHMRPEEFNPAMRELVEGGFVVGVLRPNGDFRFTLTKQGRRAGLALS